MNLEFKLFKKLFSIHDKIFFLLQKKIYKNFLFVIILLSFVTFFEILTLSLIVPIVSTFMQTKSLISNVITSSFPNSFTLLNTDKQLQILLLIFIFFFILKNIINIFLIHFKNYLIFEIFKSVSSKMYMSYIRQPFIFFLNFNSSVAIRNFQSEIPMFSRLVFSIITLIQDLVLTCSIIGFLFFINFLATLLIIIAISLVGLVYFFFINNLLKKWAQSRIFYENLKIKNILESFQGIREIKISQTENNVLNLFNHNNSAASSNTQKERTLAEFPKIFFEILILFIFILIFIFLIKFGYSSSEIVLLLSVYFFSAIRIMPCMNRIIISIQNFKFCLPSMEIIYKECQKLKKSEFVRSLDNSKLNFNNEIKLDNISFQYPKNDLFILKNINLKIKKNSIVGIFGKSGNGKTTLVNIITGLLSPSSGSIYCDSTDISQETSSWQKLLSYVPQNVYLYDDSIENNIKFKIFEEKKDFNKSNVIKMEQDFVLTNAIDLAGLSAFIDSIQNGLQSTTGEHSAKISGGQKQRIGIARAIYKNSEILILDEATNSLDSKAEEEILNKLYNLKNKLTIIIISHNKDNFKICDQIFELKDGFLYKNK
jgi:ABC-type bacteriocin/lantibiotic exporter with double-glycine peptidase domain